MGCAGGGNWYPCCDECAFVSWDFDSGASGGPLNADWTHNSILYPVHEINGTIAPEDYDSLSAMSCYAQIKSSVLPAKFSTKYKVHGDASKNRSRVNQGSWIFLFKEGKVYHGEPATGTNEQHRYTITGVTTVPWDIDSGGTFDITLDGETGTVDWDYGNWRQNIAAPSKWGISERYAEFEGIGALNVQSNTPPDADTAEIEFDGVFQYRDITIPLPTFDTSNLSGSPSVDSNTRHQAASRGASEEPPVYSSLVDGDEFFLCGGGDSDSGEPGVFSINGAVKFVVTSTADATTWNFGDVSNGVSGVEVNETYHSTNAVCPRCGQASWPMRDDIDDGLPAELQIEIANAAAINAASDCVADNCDNLNAFYDLELIWSDVIDGGPAPGAIADEWEDTLNGPHCEAVWQLELGTPVSTCGLDIDTVECAVFNWRDGVAPGDDEGVAVFVALYDSANPTGNSVIHMSVHQREAEDQETWWARDGVAQPLDVHDTSIGGGFALLSAQDGDRCHDVEITITPVFAS